MRAVLGDGWIRWILRCIDGIPHFDAKKMATEMHKQGALTSKEFIELREIVPKQEQSDEALSSEEQREIVPKPDQSDDALTSEELQEIEPKQEQSDEALTSKELREIEPKQEQSDEAVKRMLDLIETKSDAHLECFLDSLMFTGHKETYDFILSHYGIVSLQTALCKNVFLHVYFPKYYL